MAVRLERSTSGVIALYVDGELQLDSRDERVYHEALALPALALAERRGLAPIRALICGGGDGLIARELLKSPAVAAIDLVDYDPSVLEIARTSLVELNAGSLANPRTRVHVADVREFVRVAAEAGERYDVVVSDLTVPDDQAGVRLHSVDWYQTISRLLGPSGVLAVNAISPAGVPGAYWSIYNSLRSAGLWPRPYRIALPSFAAAGYGNDWGFFVGSPAPILLGELDADLPLAKPRSALRDPEHLRRLFVFPRANADHRSAAQPTDATSDLLLSYINGGALSLPRRPFGERPGPAPTWSIFDEGLASEGSWAEDSTPLLEVACGTEVLTERVRAALAGADAPDVSASDAAAVDREPIDGENRPTDSVLRRVLDLLPSLGRDQTREMVSEFVSEPARFLESFDIKDLVERLLRRAAELPARIVAELRYLRDRLDSLLGDREALLRLGIRVIAILTVVIILGNLIYPDAVYGKGTSSGGAAGSTSSEAVSLSNSSHGAYAAFTDVGPDYVRAGGFRSSGLGRDAAVDETGTLFPTRRYYYYGDYYGGGSYHSYYYNTAPAGQRTESTSYFRLTDETDVLLDGKVAVNVSDAAYLLLADEVTTLVDRNTGSPIVFLARDQSQIWRAAQEINRQRFGLTQSAQAKQSWINWVGWLGFTPWNADDHRELTNMNDMSTRLDLALKSLGKVPSAAPPISQPPVSDAVEAFSGVWLLRDGSAVVLARPAGEMVYLDGRGWFADREMTKQLGDPYPVSFKPMIVALLQQQLKDRDATRARLTSDVETIQADVQTYTQDKSEYEALRPTTLDTDDVDYGTSQIPLAEALRLTNDDLTRSQQRLTIVQRQLDALPGEADAATKTLAMLAK